MHITTSYFVLRTQISFDTFNIFAAQTNVWSKFSATIVQLTPWLSCITATVSNNLTIISVVSVVSNSRLRPWNVALLRNQVLQTHALTLESVQPPIYISISPRNVYSFLRSIRCCWNQVSKFTALDITKNSRGIIIRKWLWGMSFCKCLHVYGRILLIHDCILLILTKIRQSNHINLQKSNKKSSKYYRIYIYFSSLQVAFIWLVVCKRIINKNGSSATTEVN